MSEKINLYELLNSSIQPPRGTEVNFSSLHALLRAILEQLDNLRDTLIQTEEEEEDGVSEQVSGNEALSASEIKELPSSGLTDPAKPSHTSTAPGSPPNSGENLKEESDVRSATEDTSGPQQQSQPRRDQTPVGLPMSQNAETISRRSFSKLMERVNKIEALVVLLMEEKVDQSQLKDLRELINKKADASKDQSDQLNQRGALTDFLMSDWKELEALEEIIMNPASTETASGSVDPDGKVYCELKQKMSFVRRFLQKLEDNMKQLEPDQVLTEESTADENLQDQHVSEQTLKDEMSTHPATMPPSAPPGPQQQSCPKIGQIPTSGPVSTNASVSESCTEMAVSQRSFSKLMERFDKLEALVASLKEAKVDQSQMKHLQELINKKVDVSESLSDQLKKQEALIDHLMSDHEKLESLEEMIINPARTETASGSVDPDGKVYRELKGQISYIRKFLQKLEADIKQLKVKQALTEESMADQQRQDQDAELVNSLQRAILQLQAECEKLQETTRSLQEDNSRRLKDIQELFKTTEELQENKADKLLVESATKTDQLALDGKVSRVQFDSVTEELNTLFQELLNKVTGQEQKWHQVISRLSSEMACKLNRMEFDPVKKQLEDRWEKIHKKLQNQDAPECDDAAALKTFHCLSCDRRVTKNFLGPNLMELPISSGEPSNKGDWQFTLNPQKTFQQHNRSLYLSGLKDYTYPRVSRSCGGKETIITRPMYFSKLRKIRERTARAWKSLPPKIKHEIEESTLSLGADGILMKEELN